MKTIQEIEEEIEEWLMGSPKYPPCANTPELKRAYACLRVSYLEKQRERREMVNARLAHYNY
jgi:hypothetical protein